MSAPWIPLKRVGRLYGVLIRLLFTFSKPGNQLKQMDVSYETFNLDELMMGIKEEEKDEKRRDKYDIVKQVAEVINTNISSSQIQENKSNMSFVAAQNNMLHRILSFSSDCQVERLYAKYTSNMESPLGKIVVVGFLRALLNICNLSKPKYSGSNQGTSQFYDSKFEIQYNLQGLSTFFKEEKLIKYRNLLKDFDSKHTIINKLG